MKILLAISFVVLLLAIPALLYFYIRQIRADKAELLKASTQSLPTGAGYQKLGQGLDRQVIKTTDYECTAFRRYHTKNLNRPISVEVRFDKTFPDFFGIEFSGESRTLGWFSAIFGITDVRSGDSTFDDKVAVDCPSRTFAQNFLFQPRVRELILALNTSGFNTIKIHKNGLSASSREPAVIGDNNYNFTEVTKHIFELSSFISADYTLLVREAGGIKKLIRSGLLLVLAVFCPAILLQVISYKPYTPVYLSDFIGSTCILAVFGWGYLLSRVTSVLKQSSGYHKPFPAVALGGLVISGVAALAVLVYINGIFDYSSEVFYKSAFVRTHTYRSGKRNRSDCIIGAWEEGQSEYTLPYCNGLKGTRPGTNLILGIRSGFLGHRWISTFPQVKE